MTQKEEKDKTQINGISEELFRKAANIYFDLYRDRTKAIREFAYAITNVKVSISRDYLNDKQVMI